MLKDLCMRAGYTLAETNPGRIRVVAAKDRPAAPYIEGDLTEVLHLSDQAVPGNLSLNQQIKRQEVAL